MQTKPTTNAIQRRAQETWEAFCEDLKGAGSQLIRDDLYLDELDAAEGLRRDVGAVGAQAHRDRRHDHRPRHRVVCRGRRRSPAETGQSKRQRAVGVRPIRAIKRLTKVNLDLPLQENAI
mgnify:CR=1 FL=1